MLVVILAYQAWSFHVFRGRLRGPRVGSSGPGPVVPAPRRRDGATPAAPSPEVAEVTGRRADGRPVLKAATGGLVLLLGWLLVRLVPVGRATDQGAAVVRRGPPPAREDGHAPPAPGEPLTRSG